MKRALWLFSALLLLISSILLIWLVATESGLHWTYRQVKAYLPGKLVTTKLQGRLIGPINATHIEFEQAGVIIRTGQLTLDWSPTALLTAKISINRLHVQSLNVVLPQSKPTDQPLILPEVYLPWRTAVKNAVINGVSISQNSQTLNLQHVKLNANTHFSRIDIEEFHIDADKFSINIKGELQAIRDYRHDLKILWQASLPTDAVVNGRGRLAGDVKGTQIKQQISGPLLLTLDAEIRNLLNRIEWQAKVDGTAFDTSKLYAELPIVRGELHLQGNGDLETSIVFGTLKADNSQLGPFDADLKLQRLSDGVVQIDHLKLYSPLNNTHLHAGGQWLPGKDGGDMNLALYWKNLRWPLQGKPWFDSAGGSGWIQGKIHQYQIGLATERPWPQAPPSSWYASAEGNLDGMNFHSLRVSAFKGETTATGKLSWLPQLTWQAQIHATNIDPASLWPSWPGQLKVALSSKGRLENGQLIVDTDISQLKGKLRDYPVSLSSRLQWSDNSLSISRFNMHSGNSHAKAQGRIGETSKLDWSINSSDLAELHPHAHGKLHAQGKLSGTWSKPVIQTSFNGQALSLPDIKVGTVKGKLNMDLYQWQRFDIQLVANNLQLKNYNLQSVEISGTDQRLDAKAIAAKHSLTIALQGQTDDRGWHGNIEKADISSQIYQNWRLKKPIAIHLSAATLNTQPLCWSSNKSAICLQLKRERMSWKATLNAENIPLKLFSPVLPLDLQLDGMADAKADFHYRTDRLLGEANIRLAQGTVSYPLLEGEREHWAYAGGQVAVRVNQRGLEATSEFAMSKGDEFRARLTLPDANLLHFKNRQQAVKASAQLNIHNLGIIEALLPEVQDLQGKLLLNFATTGTLAQPLISGRAELSNGTLRIPRLGLTIDHISLNSQSSTTNRIDFNLNAHSGTGTLGIQGQTKLDKNAGWPTTLTIKGKEFEVSRIPEARVQISPELHVSTENRKINITGKIHIPYAKLQPKDVTTAAHVSEDVVIINQEQTVVPKWTMLSKIRLTLGEQVHFFGFGFDGRLNGDVLLEEEPGQLTKATGEIKIPEGRYRAYGQRLDVEHGRLLYTSSPLINPGLDLRAVRKVGNVTSGLKVKGSLNQPQVELFSIPAMGQTDALAYLLLGRPIENASGEEGAMMAKAVLALGLSGGDRLARTLGEQFGLDEMRLESDEKGSQASLVMGRYLSPRLYVSYGVGLIEAINTFTVRYRISDHWQLKGESGKYEGADFLYTIER